MKTEILAHVAPIFAVAALRLAILSPSADASVPTVKVTPPSSLCSQTSTLNPKEVLPGMIFFCSLKK